MSSLDVRAIDETELRKERRPATRQELAVFLSEEAFDRAVERGDRDTSREIGGVLVGEVLRDASGPYLRIETTIDALHADEKGAELTFTHATWEHIHKEMDTRHQGKRVVGWYHTHPGFGVFLSDRDQFIHKSFFNLPFQVAFVYDPKSKEHGLFTWRDNEVWRARRYAIGPRDHTWDGNRTSARPAEAAPDQDGDGDRGKDGDRDRDRDRDRDPGGDDRRSRERDEEPLFGGGSLAPLVMIGLLLVLVAAFVGHWFGAGSADATIRQAQIEIAKARSDGAEGAVAQLQHELVEVLRQTLGDQAIHAPALQAIAAIDGALAKLAPTGADASSTPPAPSTPPIAAPSAPPAGPPAPPPPGPPPVQPGTAAMTTDPRIAHAITVLRSIRERFVGLTVDRSAAETLLGQIELRTRHGSELRTDLVRDVAEQRSGIGGLYAELADAAAKGGDVGRAQRLLTTAAHLDPGNRARYEKQLQSFAKGATLPRGAVAPGAPGTPGPKPMQTAPTGIEGGKP